MQWCSGCTTALERMPHDREVMGSNPAGRWAFFPLLFPISGVPYHRGATPLIFLKHMPNRAA